MQNQDENLTKLITLVKSMRNAQKEFFKAKRTNNFNTPDYLKKSKEAEKTLDKFLDKLDASEFEKRQTKLF